MDKEIFLNLLKERILILDGGMGTMVQGFKLTEKDYRGKQFADWTSDLKGNNDLLCITRPDVINPPSVSGCRCRYFCYQHFQCKCYLDGGLRHARAGEKYQFGCRKIGA